MQIIWTKRLPRKFFTGIILAFLLAFCSQETYASDILKDSTKQRVPLMKKIENFALKDNLVSKLLRNVLVFNNEEPSTDNNNNNNSNKDTTKVSEKPFNKYENKTIRNINIQVLNPFGYSVNTPVCHDINWFEKLGNRVHYPTRAWIVKNKLLFRKNEQIDAFKISESERLLRQSSYINDAKILVNQVNDSTDSVDVTIYVQDVWGIGVGVTGDPSVPNGDISFNDNNFLGLGQRLDTKLWYDEKYYNHIKFNGSYNVSEISTTYISARMYYLTENRDQIFGVNFNRPFYSPTTPWAGGLTLEYKNIYYDVLAVDSIRFTGINDITQQDVWAGYAFKSGPEKSLYRQKSQIVVAGRIANVNFIDKNKLRTDVAELFHNETVYLGSVGYSFREYYKDRFIFGFGRTEDIPLGKQAVYTAGISNVDGIKRFYSGIKLSYAKTHSSLGYLYSSIETGGYLHNKDVEQGVVGLQILYFTNLIPVGRWQIRQFWLNRFTLGYNRKPGEQLNINEGQGLRVFASDRIGGTQKLVSNYELNFFTPYTPLGFRIVPVVFVDFALIGTKDNPFYNSRFYQGYGLGVRLKNEHLVFRTFQLSLHYYPGAKDFGTKEFKYFHTEHSYYSFPGFEIGAPYTLGF